MLEQIICYLVQLTSQTNYFEKIIPFARLSVGAGGKTSPTEYLSNGQKRDITIFDHFNGLAYFRANGKQRVGYSTKNEVPCYDEFLIDIPIRLVGAVPKKKLTKDDAFAEERITQTLMSMLSVRHSELTKVLKAGSVTFLPNNITTDGNVIAQEEYKGLIKDINYNFAYVAVDFTASIKIKINCIEPECDFTLADIPVPPNTTCFFTSCENLKAYIDAKSVTGFKKINLTSGVIDGVNKIFVWDEVPLFVLWQGQKLTEGAAINGYTLAGTTTTLTDAPMTGDSLEAYGNY